MSVAIESVTALSHDARILAMDADGNYTSAEIDYIVTFTQDGGTYKDNDTATDSRLEESALNAVREVALDVKIGDLKLKSLSVKERLAPSAFTVTASYTEKDESESGSGSGTGGGGGLDSEPQMTFECSAEMKHVTLANRQGVVKTFDPTNWPLNWSCGNLIGWNGKYGDDFAAEGCDTPTGVAVETWIKQMSYSQVTTAKKIKWAEAVGKVNAATWKGWPPRCAMFMGASFSKEKRNGSIQVSFHFRVGPPNETVLLDGNKIVVQKSPFDYIWAVKKEAAGKRGDSDYVRTPSVAAIVVAEVAETTDFNLLGI